jgi:uncharacterized protein
MEKMDRWYPLGLLVVSNVFMTFAWYGHLKTLSHKPLWIVIFISWGIAFFEYCFQVPGNRLGAQYFSVPQLKIIQEIITLAVFAVFSYFYLEVRLSINYLWAGLCMIGAVFFIFRDGFSG